MKKETYVAIALSVLLVLLFSGGAVWAQPKTPVSKTKKLTVGYTGAMSGPAAAWGQAFAHGCELAIEDINAKGGITVGNVKYLLELKIFDHAYDPAKVVEISKRMISVDKVAWIVSHGTTAVKPVVPFAEENKVVFMTAVTGTEVSTFMKQNYTYRWINSGPEAPFLGWIWNNKVHPEWKTTVEVQPDDASGWETIKDLREWILPKFGVKSLADVFFKRGITDFYPILVKCLAEKPDVFDLSILPPGDAGRIIKQAREMGYKGPFVYPVGSSIAPVIEIAGEFAEGLIFGANMDPTSRFATPQEKVFYDRWMKVYGPPYDYCGIPATYSIYSVAQAIEKANSFDPEKVTKIIQTTEFNALGRKIGWGGVSRHGPPPRQAIYPYGIFVVEKGKPKMTDMVMLPADY